MTTNQAFFIEVSNSSSLNFRQACAVESFMYRNPNFTAQVLISGRMQDITNSTTIKILTKFYSNFRLTNINVEDYMSGTMLEQWYFCSNWKDGNYTTVHLADALRLLSLSKYGGYYFDLDVIHRHPVAPYRNFVVNEDNGLFGNSIIHADLKYRSLMEMAVEEFATTYR